MNKYAYAIIALLLPAFLSSCSDRSAAGYNTGINITPKPLEMTVNEGGFKLGPNTVFYCPAPESAAIASFFSGKIKASTGYTAGVSEVQPDKDYISLEIKQGLPVNDEGYLMEVDGKGVRIEA